LSDIRPISPVLVVERYRVQRELGRGGMATVYLARDEKQGRLVALKVLRPDLASALGVERFLREIAITSRLSHPHILPLYDSGTIPAGGPCSGPYYAMAYVEGESLRARLDREPQLSVDTALQITLEVAEALEYAHRNGIVHRDIKPENILFSQGHALVADFGIARAVEVAGGEALTATGISVGTPYYMSPEQASDSRRLDGRSDLYSLACVLFEMLAGQPPFTGRTAQAILARHALDAVPSLRTVRPTVPLAVEQAVTRALAKVPADRWPGVAEFANALGPPGGGSAELAGSRSRAMRRVLLGLAVVAVVGAGYLALRSTNAKAGDTLMATGALRDRERVLLADFDARGADTLLAGMVTTALRIDLSRSPSVSVVPSAQVAEVLERMRRPPEIRLDPALAREIGVREGIKAVITGQIGAAGRGYVLAAEVVTAENGEALAAVREVAEDSTDLVAAIDRLSKGLRERVGESVQAMRAQPPLERVTTHSLEALRKYALAVRTRDREGDDARAIALLDEAIALDTGFAMAYRTRAMAMASRGGELDQTIQMFKMALERADRLPERERNLTRAAYYTHLYEGDKAMAAYRSLLEAYPDDPTALRGLGNQYAALRDYARAESLLTRALGVDSLSANPYIALSSTQVDRGRWQEAKTTLELAARRFPDNAPVLLSMAQVEASRGNLAAAEAHARTLLERHGEVPSLRGSAIELLGHLSALRGKVREAEAYWREAIEANPDVTWRYLYTQDIAQMHTWLLHDPVRARRVLDSVLRRHPLSGAKLHDRPYLRLAVGYASAGRPDQARPLLDDFVRLIDPGDRRMRETIYRWAKGYLALAEGRFTDAVTEFRQGDRGSCTASCGLAELGVAFDRLGNADSAIAAYERYLARPGSVRFFEDASLLAHTYERLGELYEEKGDLEKAGRYYSRFATLWRDCDPEVQPRVARVRAALARVEGRDSK
jgi:serine/threonine-protein kinase